MRNMMRYLTVGLLAFVTFSSTSLKADLPFIAEQHNPAQITFTTDAAGLHVEILTEHLYIRSVEATEEEYDNYAELFGDRLVMEKYGAGNTRTPEEIRQRIDESWVKRWRKHDPFSGLAVFERLACGNLRFIGHIILGHGDLPGESELAFLFMPFAWNHGYGKEAAKAVAWDYAAALIHRGYEVEGEPLRRITATTRSDNVYSEKILLDLGMQYIGSEEKYGALRLFYVLE